MTAPVDPATLAQIFIAGFNFIPRPSTSADVMSLHKAACLAGIATMESFAGAMDAAGAKMASPNTAAVAEMIE